MPLCASVYMCLVVTCCERADLLALVCGVLLWVCHFPIGILGQEWYWFLIFAPLLTLIRRCTAARSETRLETRYMFIRIHLYTNKYLKIKQFVPYVSFLKVSCQNNLLSINVQFRMICTRFGNMNYCCRLQTFWKLTIFPNVIKYC